MDFKYQTISNGDSTTLQLSGRLDTLSAVELDKEVKTLIANLSGPLDIEISGLTYISSSGLRCFVELLKACRAKSLPLTITGMQPAIREIFDLTGFSKVFTIK